MYLLEYFTATVFFLKFGILMKETAFRHNLDNLFQN